MIISTESEKAIDKIQHPFMIKKKTLENIDIEGTYFNIIQAKYDKPTANIILISKKLKAFPLISGTRQGCPFLPLLFKIVLEVLAIAIREEKEIKRIQIGKKKQNSPLADNMMVYIENPKDAIRKLLEVTNKYSKVTGYKVNTQKFLEILYVSNEISEREIKETIPFTITMKRVIYLGISLPKETKDLYSEKYKTLMKETKDDTIDGEIYHDLGFEESI